MFTSDEIEAMKREADEEVYAKVLPLRTVERKRSRRALQLAISYLRKAFSHMGSVDTEAALWRKTQGNKSSDHSANCPL